MKFIAGCLLVALGLPVSAGIIRHDIPDSRYTGFANSEAYEGVGLIVFDTPEASYTCSGTVIHKNWVLTAAHCVDDAIGMSFLLPNETGWRFFEAKSWIAHEKFSDDSLAAGWDIGLMRFESDFDVQPARLYRGTDEWLSHMASVGYGRTGNGLTGDITADYRKRGGTNMVDDLWSSEGSGDQIIWADFDHPHDPAFNLFDYPDFTFDNFASALEIMAAPGDSGGGVFIEEGAQTYLAGVHSFGGDFNQDGIWGYGDAYGSTRVSSFLGWIDRKMNPIAVPESPGLGMLLIGGLMLAGTRKYKARLKPHTANRL